MPLLRRRNWQQTALALTATCLAFAGIVFWARPGFMEKHYYSKQRLWAQFLATCDCNGQTCPGSFDFTIVHPTLYSRLLAASQRSTAPTPTAAAATAAASGTSSSNSSETNVVPQSMAPSSDHEPVQQYLIWQPYKLGVMNPAYLKMFAHWFLMMPRCSLLLHWWLHDEELVQSLRHLAQGVPLALDPSSEEANFVEPDAIIECTLEAEAEATTEAGVMSAGDQPGGSSDVKRSGGDKARPFRCVLLEARGRLPLLQIPPPPGAQNPQAQSPAPPPAKADESGSGSPPVPTALAAPAKDDAGRRRHSGEFTCHNVIVVRPPRRAEVSEHVREQEASPLALPPLELLRRLLLRAADVAGWVLLPHAMWARYVLLMVPAAVEEGVYGSGSSGGGGGGSSGLFGPLPVIHMGTLLMLLAGALLTMFELLVIFRVVSELMSYRRPGRPCEVAWRVLLEGFLQPIYKALLVHVATLIPELPPLRRVMSDSACDIMTLVALTYCTTVLGAAACDVASRATPALLQVAWRIRERGHNTSVLLLTLVQAANPDAVPLLGRPVRLFMLKIFGANSLQMAVAAAMAREAPALAVEIIEPRRLRRRQRVDGGGDAWVDLAMALLNHMRHGPAGAGIGAGGGGQEGEEEAGREHPAHEEEEEEQEEEQEEKRSVSLHWPAPLQLPAEVHEWDDVPRGFTCAITQHVMSQPAMLVSPELPAAPTYERAAIQQWLAGHMRDPKSNTALASYTLLPNEDLRRAIDDWVAHRTKRVL